MEHQDDQRKRIFSKDDLLKLRCAFARKIMIVCLILLLFMNAAHPFAIQVILGILVGICFLYLLANLNEERRIDRERKESTRKYEETGNGTETIDGRDSRDSE